MAKSRSKKTSRRYVKRRYVKLTDLDYILDRLEELEDFMDFVESAMESQVKIDAKAKKKKKKKKKSKKRKGGKVVALQAETLSPSPSPTTKKVEKKPVAVEKAASKAKTPTKKLNIAKIEGKDDLKKIKGIGPMLEKELNRIGIHNFKQLSLLSEPDAEAVDEALGIFPGRMYRENWVGQAKDLL